MLVLYWLERSSTVVVGVSIAWVMWSTSDQDAGEEYPDARIFVVREVILVCLGSRLKREGTVL